ncbi:MAG: BatD family protein [Bacteroidota bacterium]
MKSLLVFFLAFFLSTLAMAADSVEFSASAPAEVAVGERFRLVFQVNKRPSEFNPPAFSGFRILSGPSQSTSTSMQIINGRTTVNESFSYTYILEAVSEGTFTIPPASIVADGDDYQSNQLTISVKPGTSAPSPGASQSQPSQVSDQDLFIRATPSKTNPYQGEQVIVTYTIFTRINVNQYSINKLPSFQGYWTENISSSGQPQTRTQVIDGQTYRVAEIYRVAVFAQRSGELTIDPMEVELLVSLPGQRRQSLFDEFFGGSPFDRGRTINKLVESNSVTLNVRPLPVQNQPATFSGMVGSDFTVEATLSPEELDANDAANLKITISGKGNMKMTESPELNFPPNLEVFDPNVTDNIRNTTSGVSGSRTFEYVMIPRTGGEFVIPSWDFVYFDPSARQYVTRQTPEFTLQVSGDELTSATAPGTASQEAIKTISTDIRFIHTGKTKLLPEGSIFVASNLFWILLILPFLLFAFFVIYWRNHIKLRSNEELLRNKRAEKLARKRLKKARVFMEKKQENEFYDEIFRALWGYLSDKLSIPVSILNKENVAGAFKAKKVDQELSDNFINTLNDCEFARFAPGEKEDRMADIYQKALDTIITIERDLRNKKD